MNNIVAGDTVWAVSMASATKHTPVYIFGQITRNWHIFRSDRSEFVKCDNPILTINFGDIGTHEIDLNELNVIQNI